MMFYWKMPKILTPFFKKELALYHAELNRRELTAAWRHLERAHIIGQAWFIEHSLVHWKMLCFGIRIKNAKEIAGQIPRLLLGGVKSFVGKIPTGNTGGANVPGLRPMEIPADLRAILALGGV
jgi:hypothetical protein